MTSFRFTATLWRYRGDGGWHFVTVPHDVADEIEEIAGPRRGFGSVRVDVTLGATSWSTSLFPDTAAASYLLPVKRSVRDAEGVGDGDEVRIEVRPAAT